MRQQRATRPRSRTQPPGDIGSTSEYWLIKLTLFPTIALLYGALLVNIEDIRRGRGKLKPTDYAGTAYHVAMLSAAARGTLGLATAAWFILLVLVSLFFDGVWDTWLVVAGLALGWTAALGVLASLLRMGTARLLERRVDFLLRSRLAEPWRWDIVWQAVVATGAAIWAL